MLLMQMSMLVLMLLPRYYSFQLYISGNDLYPGYQRIFLASDEELRRPQADMSSAFGRRHDRRLFRTNGKPRTVKSLWHQV